MDLIRRVGEEISKTMDSSQAQKDATKKEDRDEPTKTVIHHEKENRPREESSDSLRKDWGDWEDFKTTPKATPTSLKQDSLTPTKSNTSQATPTSSEKSKTTPTKAKTQMDTLSKEELIKHVKKQTLLLQKMKSRSEELNLENTKLKDELCDAKATPSGNEHIFQELQVLKAERDQALAESKSVKQIIVTLEQNEKEKMESFENQISLLKSDNSALRENLSQLSIATATGEEKFENEKAALNEKLVSLNEEMKVLLKERDSLVKELECLREKQEKMKMVHEEEVTKLREELDSQVSRVQDQTEEIERMKLEGNEKKEKVEQELLQQLEETKRELNLLQGKEDERNRTLETEIENLKEQLTLYKEKELQNNDRLESLETQLFNEQKEKQNENDLLNQQLLASSKEKDELTEMIESIKLAHEQEMAEIKKTQQVLENELAGKTTPVQVGKEHQEENVELKEKLSFLQSEKEELSQKLREQESQHKEEVKKFKAIAVKLKKELTDLKSQPDELSEKQKEKDCLLEEMKTNLDKANSDLKSISEELEKEKLITQEQTNKIQELSNELKTTRQELSSSASKFTSEKDKILQELEENSSSFNSQLETLKAELLSSHSSLSSSKQNLSDRTAEVESLRESLSREKEEHNETKEKLAAANKEAKSSSLMNLELEDYQRSLEALRGQLKEGQLAKGELEKKLSSQRKQNEELRKEFESYKEDACQKDEIIAKMKVLLRKTTKELSEAKAQCTENNETIEESKREIEKEKRNFEMAKVEIAELTAKLQSNSEQFGSSQTHYQQLIHSLECKSLSLQKELTSVTESLESSQSEFENYKVRVHSVLKQKQSAPSVTELEDNLRQHYEVEQVKLKIELKDTQDRLTSLLSDYEQLEGEHQELLGNHDDSIRSNNQATQQLQEQLRELTETHRLKTQELEMELSQLKLEKAESTSAFKSQIHAMQNEYQSQWKSYQEQLQQAHNEISRLQHDADTLVLSKGSNPTESVKTLEVKSAPLEERSSGEGMDCVELEVSGLATTPPHQPNDGTVSLERLLSTSSHTTDTNESPQLPVDKETQRQLLSSLKKISHLTDLLHESEANSIRLSDQTKLLKEEIRRLERNQERQKEAAANMEYLKNVVLKFLRSSNEERRSLVPIISKLLQLSQQEKAFLQETLRGKKPDLPDATGTNSETQTSVTKGLANYLQRWTGYQ